LPLAREDWRAAKDEMAWFPEGFGSDCNHDGVPAFAKADASPSHANQDAARGHCVYL